MVMVMMMHSFTPGDDIHTPHHIHTHLITHVVIAIPCLIVCVSVCFSRCCLFVGRGCGGRGSGPLREGQDAPADLPGRGKQASMCGMGAWMGVVRSIDCYR